MLMGAFGYSVPDSVEEDPYRDVSVDDWHAPYAALAKKRNLVGSGAIFAPNYNLSRADVAQLLYNVMKDRGVLR